MTTSSFGIIRALDSHHVRLSFSCNVPALDRYLHTQANQDARRHLTAVFALTPQGSEDVIGYYTLSSAHVDIAHLPVSIQKKLPHYPHLPAILIGRLAVSSHHHGRGIGQHLLMDALFRCYRSEVASMAVIVDAKDDKAQAFYEKYGFQLLEHQTRKLFLPMSSIVKIFDN